MPSVETIIGAAAGCFHALTFSHGLWVSLFLAGIVGGFSHCIFMCGPFALSLHYKLRKQQGMFVFFYHLGRLTTYTVMAVLFASLLNLAYLFVPIRAYVTAPMLVAAAGIFMVAAFPALKQVAPWAGKISLGLPYNWLIPASGRIVRNCSQSQSGAWKRISGGDGASVKGSVGACSACVHHKTSAQSTVGHKTCIAAISASSKKAAGIYLTGLLLGFMPCGLVLSALMAAAAAPGPWEAGTAMLCFGLGTVPALAMVSLGAEQLQKKFPGLAGGLTKGALVWSSLWLFTLAGLLLI